MKLPVSLGLLLTLWNPQSAVAQSLEDCHELALEEGPSEATSECYFLSSRSEASVAKRARVELLQIRTAHPSAPWPHYYLGRMFRDTDELEEAARLFEEQSLTSPEMRARLYLVTLYMLAYNGDNAPEDLVAAQAHLERTRILERTTDVPQDGALAAIAEAHHLMLQGYDFSKAHELLLAAYATLDQEHEVHRHELLACLHSLLIVADRLALRREARHWAKLRLGLAKTDGGLRDQVAAQSDALYNRLLTQLPDPHLRTEALEELQEILQLAQVVDDRWIEASSRLLIAKFGRGPGAERHLRRCRELAKGIEDSELDRRCTKALANWMLGSDSDEARRLLETANAQEQTPWGYLDNWKDQMRVRWRTEPPETALEHSNFLLTLFETLRHNQVGVASDRLLSASADPYYWLSGQLLNRSQEQTTDVTSAPEPYGWVGPALAVIERLRSQTLREALATAQTGTDLSSDVIEALDDIKEAYTEVSRELFRPDRDDGSDDKLVRRLRQLDREAVQIRRSIDGDNSAVPVLEPPDSNLLDRLVSALGPQEALLSYQLGLREGWDRESGGDSWLVVITQLGVRTYRLTEDRGWFERALAAFHGRRDPNDPKGIATLYEHLLEPAITELPAQVNKLLIVPDGLLHLLPFSLLRPFPEAPPIVHQFELQMLPSASVWLHWREEDRRSARSGAGALVLANPQTDVLALASSERAAALDTVGSLGALPYAEREGRNALRRLGGRGRLVRRSHASENLLKEIALDRFIILHIAAHAVLDLDHPSLSGVVLSAGSESEDGRLRPSEISRLKGLRGKLVVLAACDTASGEVLRGEGVLSLSRAFFEAGAEAVVATLWRVDDLEAYTFFDQFYARLADGKSVGNALAETQSEWSSAGEPASAWAGFVVQGNGDLVPIPGGVRRTLDPFWIGLALLLLLGAIALAIRPRASVKSPGEVGLS